MNICYIFIFPSFHIRSSNMKRRKDEYITYIFGISMPENIDVSEVVTDISKIHSVKFVDL